MWKEANKIQKMHIHKRKEMEIEVLKIMKEGKEKFNLMMEDKANIKKFFHNKKF